VEDFVSLVYNLARGASSIAGWTPQGIRHNLGSVASGASYLGWRSKRIVTQQNMAQVTGLPVHDPRVRYLAYASWRNYGRYAADFLSFAHVDASMIEPRTLDLTRGAGGWLEYVKQALQSGRGALFVTSHFGNWDMAGAMMARHVRISAVAETFSDQKLNELVQNQRREKGIEIIPMESSARRILRALHGNQFVGIVFDRPMPVGEGIPVRFFGRKTYVPAGTATLAIKSGAAIMPGYFWYGHHNHFYIRAFPPIFPRQAKGEEQAGEVARLTQYLFDTMEEVVREWPTQWYMFRPFWPLEI
jgi:KDO2-lipid IV(A) lauroyltransferase